MASSMNLNMGSEKAEVARVEQEGKHEKSNIKSQIITAFNYVGQINFDSNKADMICAAAILIIEKQNLPKPAGTNDRLTYDTGISGIRMRLPVTYLSTGQEGAWQG